MQYPCPHTGNLIDIGMHLRVVLSMQRLHMYVNHTVTVNIRGAFYDYVVRTISPRGNTSCMYCGATLQRKQFEGKRIIVTMRGMYS